MRKAIINLLKYTGLTLSGFILFIGLYMLAAWFLSHISTAKEQSEGSIPLYILTNGVHTDLVMPVNTEVVNWNLLFPISNTTGNDTSLSYIAIGWGDKGFYLNTPTWNDLTFSTAFNAVFGLSSTAIHATYHSEPSAGNDCRKVNLTPAQYQRLLGYIKSCLAYDSNGNPQLIHTTANYGTSDAFYEAKGTYSLFHTCNTWTNNGLKSCGQKACWWTPFQSGIFYQYQ
jgi:uncharacterized protein (TIGR02117 family)